MRTRATGRSAGFKTSKTVLEILGGNQDYTRESYGFIKKGKGIASTYGRASARSNPLEADVVHTFHMPETNHGILVLRNNKAYMIPDGIGLTFTYCDYIGERQWMMASHARYKGGAPVLQYTLFTNNGGFGITKDLFIKRFSPSIQVGGALEHMNRVFFVDGADRFRIIWTARDCNDPTDVIDVTEGLDKGGSLRISPEAGEIDCLYELGDDIIIVCKNGIKVMHALSDPRHFAVKRSLTNTFPQPFYPDAGAVCRGKLWLGTSYGMYVFDGKTIEHVNLDCCFGELEPRCTFIRAFNERFIDVLIQTYDGNRYVLEYDVDTGHSVKFAKGCSAFLRNSSVFLTFYPTQIKYHSAERPDADFFWETRPVCAEDDGLKLVKSLSLDCVGDFKVTVTSERGSRTVEGNGSHPVGVYGRSFTFRAEGRGELKSLKAVVEARK